MPRVISFLSQVNWLKYPEKSLYIQTYPLKGCVLRMGKRRGIMSESFKYELAKDLGFYDTVKEEGWGAIRARDAGNMVKRAIEIAESQLAGQNSDNK
jgi:small acid-soluble spore protein F (minor alpha/beta-type SASP)